MKQVVFYCLSLIFLTLKLEAQHLPGPPKLKHPSLPSGHYFHPPIYDPVTHQEIVNDVMNVIEHFKQINDPNVGIVDFNDTVNRQMAKPFPSLYFFISHNFPKKPSDNYTNQTYVNNYSIASKIYYDEEKKNKYDDIRAIINYKTGSIINVSTTKDGIKKATEMQFSTLNMAPDGTLKVLNAESENGIVSITATEEYKIISGNKCRKYLKTDGMGNMEIWMAEGGNTVNEQLVDALIKGFFINSVVPNTFSDYKSVLKGIPVQLVYIPKSKSSPQCIITYEKMQPWTYEEQVFSTSGYEVKQLKSLQDIFNSR